MAKRSDESLYMLPETSEASKRDKTRLDALLKEAHSLKGLEARLKEVKTEIVELIQSAGLAADGKLGCRSGNQCAIVRWQNGRESLKRELLIDAGVTIEQLAAATTTGKGGWVCELPEIGKE